MHAPVASELAVDEVPKKKAKLTKEPSAGSRPCRSERVSQRSSVPPPPPDYFNPDGSPTEGDSSSASEAMASAGRSRRAFIFGGLCAASVATSSHVGVPFPAMAMASADGPQSARTATPELFRPGSTLPRSVGCRASRGHAALAEALPDSV
jgi:hypothetical protein